MNYLELSKAIIIDGINMNSGLAIIYKQVVDLTSFCHNFQYIVVSM